jgi:hypothetical protein
MSSDPRSFVTAVSGLPRSGTSMMMQMLAAGGMPILSDNIRKADDDNLRGYYEFEPVKRTKDDASWLKEAQGKVVKLVYTLLYDLPADCAYRVVFMHRHLDEVLASQRVMLDRRGEKGATVSPDRLRRIFEGQLEKVRAWLARQPHFEVIHVDYHHVINDPESQARRIADFLGGKLDLALMAAAVDGSLYRQHSRRSPLCDGGNSSKI